MKVIDIQRFLSSFAERRLGMVLIVFGFLFIAGILYDLPRNISGKLTKMEMYKIDNIRYN